MRNTFIVILLIVALCPGQEKDSELFKWKMIDRAIGSLVVPKGYKMTSDYYGEGIFITLKYQDSSRIFLQYGFDIKIPIMDGDIIVNSSLKNDSVSYRKGIEKDNKLYWREDNWERRPINIGYYDVPLERLKDFEMSIDSFKRDIKEN